MTGLTRRQAEILNFIRSCIDKKKISPSLVEIAEEMEITPATVSMHLKALKNKGFISRSNKARSITLSKTHRMDQGNSFASIRSAPRCSKIPFYPDIALFAENAPLRIQSFQFLQLELPPTHRQYLPFIACARIKQLANSALDIQENDVGIFLFDLQELKSGDRVIASDGEKVFLHQVTPDGHYRCSGSGEEESIETDAIQIHAILIALYRICKQ